jgi:CheY-like chemotaxis protein/anti-sigma regulatory factor (Ser/Thr protein kinase)
MTKTLPARPDPLRGKDDFTAQVGDLQSTFIRNVEHELRTPLAIVQGYAELLRDGGMGTLDPDQQKAMFVIVNRAYEMRALVERIGILMSVQANNDIMIPLSLTDIAVEVFQAKREAAAQAQLAFEAQFDPEPPLVSGNPHQLHEALGCIVENAIKFTPAGGRVELRVFVEPGWVCLSVRDTGIGIEEGKLAHLFDGFYQADGSTTRRYGGIGLGLTVTKRVIDAHRGQIGAESQPGQGSLFTMRLPVFSASVQAGQTVEPAGTLRRILVVDDEENVALTLEAGLERVPNCQVSIATSGEQALRLFEEQPFDLLITDYKMPGTDGMTLSGRVRALYPKTIIVLVTAYGSEELRQQAARVSIQRILDKPVRLAEVRAVAMEVLGQNGSNDTRH